jgi:putative ABC transport system permease protein
MLLKILFRNAFRHRLRAALTICGLCVAILAFGLLRTVISAWYAGVDAAAPDRLITRNSISLVFQLPLSYREKIRGLEGVRLVSYGNWFGGIYIEEKNFFANFAVEPRTYLELYPEYIFAPDQKDHFLKNRKSCVVGRKLAARFGWKVGDIVTLRGTIFPGNWEFEIAGVYRGRERATDETLFFFHWDYLNESIRKTMPRRADQIGFYVIGLDDPDLAPGVSEAVDGLFRNSFAETLTETERAFTMGFVAMTETIITAIRLVSYIVIVIIMAVVANTMAMSVRERTGEYAILKTLGFGGLFIAGLIFGESLIITSLGGALGILLTFPVADIFAKEMANWIPVFHVETKTIYLDMVASLIVGCVAAAFPTWRAVRVKIADGLRRIG